jgi:hypothetical protein
MNIDLILMKRKYEIGYIQTESVKLYKVKIKSGRIFVLQNMFNTVGFRLLAHVPPTFHPRGLPSGQ